MDTRKAGWWNQSVLSPESHSTDFSPEPLFIKTSLKYTRRREEKSLSSGVYCRVSRRPASSQCPFKEYNRVTGSHWLGPERRGENALGYELKDLSSSSSYYFWVCSCSKTMPANQSFLEWICACLVLSGGPSRCGSKDQHSVENARQQKQEAFFPNLPREAKRSRYFLNSENSLEKTPYCVGSNLQGFGGNALNF